MAGLTVSTFMAWPHKYFIPISQSIVPSTPTYLLPDRSVRRPEFSSRLGGRGGGWCLNHGPLSDPRLRRPAVPVRLGGGGVVFEP